MKLKIFTACFVFLFAGVASAQVNPMSVASAEKDNSVEAELASFKIADGYKIELYASEELGIADPCSMRWDEKGRLWVLTIPSYPQLVPGTKPNDRLVILEDRDQNGKADFSSVFADGLHMPLGFELGHGGVYLGQQTELLFLKDTDRDGKADSREVLLSGFGTNDSHQTINSFIWSPGGELFFSQGHSIYSRVETPWGIEKADRAGIWRYRPVQRRLDGFLDGSMASVNPWGMNFGEWGQMFHKANDPELFYTVPGLIKSSHRALLPPIGKLVIKGSIIEIIRTKHLPDDLQGDFVIAGYYNNKVERMRVEEDSSGYSARLLDPILNSTSRSFRPIDIKVGPDGALYVLDWYNPIIGHYQASMRHPDRDKTHGRIWRITASNRPLLTPPNLAGTPVALLPDHLKSPEHWVRYQVKRLLAQSSAAEVAKAMDAWVEKLQPEDPAYEHNLMEAIGVYESHELVNEHVLKILAAAKESGARAYAAHVAGRWSDRLGSAFNILLPLINDADARVRLEALVAMGNIQVPEAMPAATQVLDHPMDKFLKYALEKTVFALQGKWEPALRNGELIFKNPAHLAYTIAMLPPPWYTAPQFRKLIETENISISVRRNLFLYLARIGKTSDFDYIINHPLARTDAFIFEGIGKMEPRPLSKMSQDALKNRLNAPGREDLRIQIIRLAKNWKLLSLTPVLNAFAANSNTSEKIRGESLQAVIQLRGREALPLLQKIIKDPGSSRLLKISALKSLRGMNITLAAEATIGEIQHSQNGAAELREIISPVVDQKGGIQAITGVLSKASLPADQAALFLEVLDVKGIDAPVLKKQLTGMSGKQASVSKPYSPEYVEKLNRAVLEKGDAKRGALLYAANPSCVSCHSIQGKGGTIGPDLSAIGKGLSVREIIAEVLWPNQNIKEGYNRIVLETKKGEIIQGIKLFENADIVNIGTTDSKKPRTVNKKEIAAKTETGSMMPGGLTDSYTEEEVRDLIRFLSELGN
jgi:putative heme-binding domain-containing protein